MANITPNSLASEIHTDLGSPCEIGVNSISFWLRSRIGDLNNYLYTDFVNISTDSSAFYQNVDGTTVYMTEAEKAVFKQLYFIKYYETQIRNNLGAAAIDPIQEISSDGARVKKINRNELSKSYLELKKQAVQELTDMVNSYKINNSRARQVAGDDVFDNPYNIRTDTE